MHPRDLEVGFLDEFLYLFIKMVSKKIEKYFSQAAEDVELYFEAQKEVVLNDEF